MGNVMGEFITQGELMDEVCAHILSTLQEQLELTWHTVFTHKFAELISGGKLQNSQYTTLQNQWWERVQPQIQAWTTRQTNTLKRKSERKAAAQNAVVKATILESDLTPITEKLQRALRQLVLVQTLIDQNLAPQHEKRVREELWLELAPQVERAAHCYQKSAAKRGFSAEDLIQDAAAHFQQIITRFNPEDSRRAMLGTWFDDVIDNLFAAAVRPRKADALKRGSGGPAEDETSDDLPNSPKQSLRYVRDYRDKQRMEDSLRQVDEICQQLVETGVCPFERVLAFKLYVCENLTYQEVAEALKSHGYHYGTTQMFNFVKEVKAHLQNRFEGDPFATT